jgi:hypothetical protein
MNLLIWEGAWEESIGHGHTLTFHLLVLNSLIPWTSDAWLATKRKGDAPNVCESPCVQRQNIHGHSEQ